MKHKIISLSKIIALTANRNTKSFKNLAYRKSCKSIPPQLSSPAGSTISGFSRFSDFDFEDFGIRLNNFENTNNQPYEQSRQSESSENKEDEEIWGISIYDEQRSRK